MDGVEAHMQHNKNGGYQTSITLININIFSRFFHFFSFNNVLVWTSKTPYKGSLYKMLRMEFGAWIKFFFDPPWRDPRV